LDFTKIHLWQRAKPTPLLDAKYETLILVQTLTKKEEIMGKFWDSLKTNLGFGPSGGSSTEPASQKIEDRILNADRHCFKTDEPES